MTRDRLDERIDSVAREMTAGAPRSDFRERVLSRLETRVPRPLWWRPIAIVPIAAMILIVAAVGIRERSLRVNHTASSIEARTEAGVRSSQPGAQPIPPRPVIPSTVMPDQVTSTAPTRIARRAASAEPTLDTDTMDELAPPPLEVTPIPMDGIATSRLEVPSLAMPSIAITPLDVDDHPERE
jgi:hypothetical protein